MAARTGAPFSPLNPSSERKKVHMRLTMSCIEEQVTPYTSKGTTYAPLSLTLQDTSPNPMKELVEVRIKEESDKLKYSGKVKGHTVSFNLRRVNKMGGIAIFDIDDLVVESAKPK
jgi:hypothetical protein